jgi:ketosteroid isomerase-like protein
MTRYLRIAVAAVLLTLPATASAQVASELDEYWAEVSRTVAEGDFDGYAGLYHPDAVLVAGGSGSYPIEKALAGWKQGFDDTREGKAVAGVEFRFTGRVNDETTAHETGIFRYTLASKDAEDVVALVHFEALLVKKDGRWLMVMEYQKEPATNDEWDAAA